MGLSAEFARPEWMILTVLPVPPAPVRPSVASPGKASAQDDLTYKLAEIIKANGSVEKAEQEGSPQYIINNFVELLQVSRQLLPRDRYERCRSRDLCGLLLSSSITFARIWTTTMQESPLQSRRAGVLSSRFDLG
jgi:hypothetical protein